MILVTGAAGFIGSHLVDRLLEDGLEVVGVDAFTEYYSRERKLKNLAKAKSSGRFELVEGDLLKLDLAALLRGANSVVHLAAEPGVRSSWGENFSRYLERNLWATQRLLEALSGTGTARIVFASSSSVYGSAEGGPLREDAPKRPASPYGLTKLAAEELVATYARERGVQATILRFFTVYGPRQRPEMALSRFISATLQGRPIEIFGDGTQEREMTYVSDVVEATGSAIEAPPGIYNIGGGSRVAVNELVEHVQRALGTRSEVIYGPPARGDVRSTWADLEKATKVLRYRPRIGIEEGIRAQVEWSLRGELDTESHAAQ